MPNIFSIIGQAWDFYKKHSVLNHILLWLMLIPMTVMFSFSSEEGSEALFGQLLPLFGGNESGLAILIVFIQLALSIVLIWGTACILVVGRKLLGNGAGRKRSSFKTVRQEAGKYVANIFITGILRGCFTILWGLLLIIPGIMYSIRTTFFQISIVCEGKEYRGALQHSKSIVMGHTLTVLWYTIGIALIIYIPIGVITTILAASVEAFDPRLIIPINIVTGGIWSFATMLFTISLVILYSYIKKLPKKPVVQSVDI